jgi:hypothetical protein
VWRLPGLDEGTLDAPGCDYCPEMSDAERQHPRHRWTNLAGWAKILAASAAIVTAIGGIITPIALQGGGRTPAVTSNAAPNGQSACNGATINGSHDSFNCAPTVSSTVSGAGLSSDPRARIVQLTGSWSEQGFVEAIEERDTSLVALYLKTGMKATTLNRGASAVLWAFLGTSQNGDPVALVKTFQADGFKVDDELQDGYLMQKLTNDGLPLQFATDLTPKGYTGGYEGGTFVGSLLFWIVQLATWAGPTEQDIQVIKYLISQGADCKVVLSFLKFNRDALAGTSPYEELLPMMRSCAK